MEQIKPGKHTKFHVDFSTRIVYHTISNILKQFKSLSINNFTIEMYGFTCKGDKINFYLNGFDGWKFESFDLKTIENFFAVLSEHGNTILWFNILFFNPLKQLNK